MFGNTVVFCMATVRLVPVDFGLDLLGGHLVDVVAGCAADRIQRFDQRHAGGEHRGQRARPARDRRLADDVADHRQAQQQAVDGDLHRKRPLPACRRMNMAKPATAISSRSHEYQWTKKSEMAITTSVGAGRSAPKLENTFLNSGMTKIMITAVITMATRAPRSGRTSPT
jgi:hypothetical protein